MLRLLQNAVRFQNILPASRWAARPFLAHTPVTSVLAFRSFASKPSSDEEDEAHAIVPEGRKGRLLTKPVPSSSDGSSVRTYLDVIKYVPLSDHFQLTSAQMLISLAKSEYDVNS